LGKLLRNVVWGDSPYKDAISLRTYPSGERRVNKDPPAALVLKAFEDLGTFVAVSNAFGVDRNTVSRWVRAYGLDVKSRPEVRLSNAIRSRLTESKGEERVGQWLMDEGSVSVAYLKSRGLTCLLVCGSMCDYAVLAQISAALGTSIGSSKVPGPRTLPMGAIRVQSAKAYALLQALRGHLVGLKAMEANAALEFFPPLGVLRGRHTTDEFLAPVWREFAIETLMQWNLRRRQTLSSEELKALACTWVEGRIRRARRFLEGRVPPKVLA